MILLNLLFFALLHPTDAKKPSNAILLSTVKSLTLKGDSLTTARRVKPIPQLKCVGGSAKGLYNVDVMRCKNTGSEYGTEDISWTCQASLPSDFKLGSTDVICEGYDSAEDPYVLKGSCGVEYRLVLTDEGEKKHGRRGRKSKWSTDEDQPSTIYTIFFWIVFLGIIGFLAYKIFLEGTGLVRPDARRGYRGGGGGGGWPGGDDNDPPPPYSRRPPRPFSNTQTKRSSSSAQQGWQPGFWSGAAAGAAAGYAMGNRGSNREQTAQAGPSNWFGRSSTTQSASSSSSGPSATRHESTGFGSTRRR